MRKFKSPGQAQRFLTVHGLVRNFFRVGCVIRKKEDRVSMGKTDEILSGASGRACRASRR